MDAIEPTCVMVTGGAGFIGSSVVRYLAGTVGVKVVNVDKLTYAANLGNVAPVASSPLYAFEQVDITDRTALDAVFAKHQPDAVMHLAAESHVDRSIDGPDAFIKTNINGTATVLNAARAHYERADEAVKERFRVLHVSTDEVFGSLGAEGFFTEATPYDPSSPYSASKAASDHLAIAWHRTFGLPVVLSNCSNNYGPYHLPEKLIPLVILNALDGQRLPVYGTGENVRDWLFVDDHAKALWRVLTRGRTGESYNIGGHNERTNLQVVETICDLLDKLKPAAQSRRALITFVTDRPGHDMRYAIDPTKIETELGWTAQETFDSGIEKTVQWYLDNEAWWGPLRAIAKQRQGQG